MTVTFMNEKLTVVKKKYLNGQHCLELFDEMGMPFMKATAAIEDFKAEPYLQFLNNENTVFIKNYSENQGILDALVDAGIVKDTGLTMSSGFTKLNICELLI